MARIGKIESLGDLQRFKESMSANVDQLQPYQESRLKFEVLVIKSLSLTQQQAALTAAKQEVSQQLKTVLGEAHRLATVLRFAIREHFGPTRRSWSSSACSRSAAGSAS